MLVKCINNVGGSLPEYYRTRCLPKVVQDYKWSLELGKEYLACGVGTFSGCTLYLIRPDGAVYPDFLPAPLFQVVDGRLSQNWRFWATSQFCEQLMECLFGYMELADGSNHLDDLMDGRRSALEIFNRRYWELERELRAQL